MVPCFQPINEVCSSSSGNRQTKTTVTLMYARRGLMTLLHGSSENWCKTAKDYISSGGNEKTICQVH